MACLAINPFLFDIHQVQFSDTQKNMVIQDGQFTKCIYTDPCVTLHGLYFLIEKEGGVEGEKKEEDSKNTLVEEKMQEIERQIIGLYKEEMMSYSKKPCFLLADITGTVKRNNIILKISGVWETPHQYGITYKFIQ